jgi:hypothetical protein
VGHEHRPARARVRPAGECLHAGATLEILQGRALVSKPRPGIPAHRHGATARQAYRKGERRAWTWSSRWGHGRKKGDRGQEFRERMLTIASEIADVVIGPIGKLCIP